MGASTKAPQAGLDEQQVKLAANAMRRDIIDMLEQAKSGHPGGSLSAVDAMAVLYFTDVMDYNPADPTDHAGDRFILSKGHAAPTLYAIYHQLGWITDAEMLSIRKMGSKLQGHPDSNALPGVEVCTGSLGQGLSIAAGLALGLQMDGSTAQVFTLLGDGEMQEGSNWEALMFAAHRGLGNLVAIIDYNDLQIDGRVTEVCSLGDLDAKLAAFGWGVSHVDGHDIPALYGALCAAKAATDAPQAIVMDTVKGKGVSFMEDVCNWHGVAPNAEQAAAARAELAAERERIEKGA